jgi:hypothetical protein
MLPQGRAEGNGLLGSAAQAERGRADRLGSARAGLQATGPQARFLFFLFFSHLNLFPKPFKLNFQIQIK